MRGRGGEGPAPEALLLDEEEVPVGASARERAGPHERNGVGVPDAAADRAAVTGDLAQAERHDLGLGPLCCPGTLRDLAAPGVHRRRGDVVPAVAAANRDPGAVRAVAARPDRHGAKRPLALPHLVDRRGLLRDGVVGGPRADADGPALDDREPDPRPGDGPPARVGVEGGLERRQPVEAGDVGDVDGAGGDQRRAADRCRGVDEPGAAEDDDVRRRFDRALLGSSRPGEDLAVRDLPGDFVLVRRNPDRRGGPSGPVRSGRDGRRRAVVDGEADVDPGGGRSLVEGGRHGHRGRPAGEHRPAVGGDAEPVRRRANDADLHPGLAHDARADHELDGVPAGGNVAHRELHGERAARVGTCRGAGDDGAALLDDEADDRSRRDVEIGPGSKDAPGVDRVGRAVAEAVGRERRPPRGVAGGAGPAPLRDPVDDQRLLLVEHEVGTPPVGRVEEKRRRRRVRRDLPAVVALVTGQERCRRRRVDDPPGVRSAERRATGNQDPRAGDRGAPDHVVDPGERPRRRDERERSQIGDLEDGLRRPPVGDEGHDVEADREPARQADGGHPHAVDLPERHRGLQDHRQPVGRHDDVPA